MTNGMDHQIKLFDGRRLGYRELGDPQGSPIFFFHGWPGSRVQVDYLAGAAGLGVRLIGIDRPGIGLSDFRPDGRILDWPDDLLELADRLGIGRFAVLGWSGGSPCALACAHKIPERLTACGIVAGMGPSDLDIPYQMTRNRIFPIAARFPHLASLLLWTLYGRSGTDHTKHERSLRQMQPSMAEPDRAAYANSENMRIMVDSFVEAFRQGVRGTAYEGHLLGRPWGFRLEDIRCDHFFLWHGEQDVNIPADICRAMAKAIQGSQACFYPQDGHLSIIVIHNREITGTLLV